MRWYYYVGMVMALIGSIGGMATAVVAENRAPTSLVVCMIVGSVAIILAGCLLVSFMERRDR